MKKAQAALEFLMTYGWAILVVMIVIGALSYFGVLSPTMLLPERCTLPMGLYCKNFKLTYYDPVYGGTNSTVYLQLENGMGKGIIIREINVSGDTLNCRLDITGEGNSYDNKYNGKVGYHIFNGDKSDILNVTGGLVGKNGTCFIERSRGKIKADLYIRWHYDDASDVFTHTMTGEILSGVE